MWKSFLWKPVQSPVFKYGAFRIRLICADDSCVGVRARKRAGTTLVELLVCVIFLGLCSAAMLNAIAAAGKQASIAEEKLLALAVAKNELAAAQAAARQGSIVEGSTESHPTDTGIKYPVVVLTTISLVSGHTDLYKVNSLVSWTSDVGQEHSGKVQLETYVVTQDE